MMTHLIQCLEVADPTANLDSDCSTIWCLAHIIHLAAMEILVHLKVLKQADGRAMDVDLAVDLMQEEAEMLEPEEVFEVNMLMCQCCDCDNLGHSNFWNTVQTYLAIGMPYMLELL